jgi:hypothetical protein
VVCVISEPGETVMSNPSGDYAFAGLGFTGLRFFQDGSKYIGYLYYGQGSSTAISNATYTDATGAVTFSASESPAGIVDLSFTGNIILDPSGNVIAIAGPWTGRSILKVAPVAAAPAASALAEPAAQRIGPIGPIIPILQAHGMWAAYNRQNIIP